MTNKNGKGKAKATIAPQIIDSNTACSSTDKVIVVETMSRHKLVDALMVNGKQVCQFVYNDELGWWEVSLTQMAKACGKVTKDITKADRWKVCVEDQAKRLGVTTDKVFRTVKGGDTSKNSDGINSASVQGTRFSPIFYMIGSWAHWELATTFLSFCSARYMIEMNRFITRLHTGQVKEEEVKQVADQTASLINGFKNMSFNEYAQIRVDGIEVNKAKNLVTDEVRLKTHHYMLGQ